MRFIYHLAAMALLSSCGEPGEAADTNAETATHVAAAPQFDIAGVKLGQTVEEAEATLRERGFVVQITGGGWTFEDYVGRARAQAAGNQYYRPRLDGPKGLQARRPGEQIHIELQPAAEGAIVESISYTSPASGRTREQMADELRARYGSIGRPHGRGKICVLAEPRCGDRSLRFNHIMAQMGETLHLLLAPGAEDRARWQSSFDAALRERLGTAASSF